MKRFFILTALLFVVIFLNAQSIEMIDGKWISLLKQNKSDTIYVVNFWATWCKPCMEELPAFEKINQFYKNKKVKVILVSNDFKKQIETRLKPFIVKHQLKNKIYFMNESNPNNWINEVAKSWSGAIPATLIICGKKNTISFHEGETTFEELDKIIKPLTEK